MHSIIILLYYNKLTRTHYMICFADIATRRSKKKDPKQEDRMETLEREIKKLKKSSDAGNVDLALAQVRMLAGRSSTSNEVLIAAMEALHDAASFCDHTDKDLFKMAVRACRENDHGGPLHGLIIKLIGTDTAKKAQTAVDAWKKVQKKCNKKNEHSNKAASEVGNTPTSLMNSQSQFLSNLVTQFAGRFSHRPYQFRGRGRGFRRPSPSANRPCFLCQSTDHWASTCPLIKQENGK